MNVAKLIKRMKKESVFLEFYRLGCEHGKNDPSLEQRELELNELLDLAQNTKSKDYFKRVENANIARN